MNTAQMHIDFLELVDEYTTGDIDHVSINTYLRWAAEDILDERYAPNRRKPYRGYQKFQKVTSDLRTMIKKATVTGTDISIANNIISMPVDYRYASRLDVKASTASSFSIWRRGVRPKDDNWISGNIDEPLTKKSLYYKPVYNENAQGLEVFAGIFNKENVSITDAEFRYVKNPGEFSRSASFNSSQVMDVGSLIHVDEEPVTYNGVVRSQGDTFTVIAGVLQFIGGGTASVIVNSDMPESVHLDIVRRAAIIYEGIMLEQQERQNLQQDEIES